MKNFTKKDLELGMIVETRNDNRYIVDQIYGSLILVNKDWYVDLDYYYDENLSVYNRELIDFDIVMVRKPEDMHKLDEEYWEEIPIIWKREKL